MKTWEEDVVDFSRKNSEKQHAKAEEQNFLKI